MMTKRIFYDLLAAALSLSLLAGCGGSNGSDSAASNAGSTSNGSADQSNVIKIGGIGPLTGSGAVYGIATKTGAQVAVDENQKPTETITINSVSIETYQAQ